MFCVAAFFLITEEKDTNAKYLNALFVIKPVNCCMRQVAQFVQPMRKTILIWKQPRIWESSCRDIILIYVKELLIDDIPSVKHTGNYSNLNAFEFHYIHSVIIMNHSETKFPSNLDCDEKINELVLWLLQYDKLLLISVLIAMGCCRTTHVVIGTEFIRHVSLETRLCLKTTSY